MCDAEKTVVKIISKNQKQFITPQIYTITNQVINQLICLSFSLSIQKFSCQFTFFQRKHRNIVDEKSMRVREIQKITEKWNKRWNRKQSNKAKKIENFSQWNSFLFVCHVRQHWTHSFAPFLCVFNVQNDKTYDYFSLDCPHLKSYKFLYENFSFTHSFFSLLFFMFLTVTVSLSFVQSQNEKKYEEKYNIEEEPNERLFFRLKNFFHSFLSLSFFFHHWML